MQDLILQFTTWLLAHNPNIAAGIVVLGTLRLVMKPIMTALQQIVDVTSTTTDNELLLKVISSPWYKGLTWLLDYVASVKTPQAPEK